MTRQSKLCGHRRFRPDCDECRIVDVDPTLVVFASGASSVDDHPGDPRFHDFSIPTVISPPEQHPYRGPSPKKRG